MAKNLSGFAAEFAKQRAALGAGKTFTYQGKSYSTNRADDKPAAKAAAKPAGMTSSPRPQAKPMVSSPVPKARANGALAANGGARTPNAGGKYSPTTEMRLRSAKPAAQDAMAPRSSSAGTPGKSMGKAIMTSPRPQPRANEALAANGGARKANANGKYSPTEEMRLRNMKKDK